MMLPTIILFLVVYNSYFPFDLFVDIVSRLFLSVLTFLFNLGARFLLDTVRKDNKVSILVTIEGAVACCIKEYRHIGILCVLSF